MKKISAYLLTVIAAITLLTACGPSEEEQQQQQQMQQQAIQDSLEQQRMLMQQRMDSMAAAQAQARADSIAAAEAAPEPVQFDPNGAFAVQVEAWRSSEKAEAQVSKWIDRGFQNAYVVTHGNEATGNIWFRVRLGRVSTLEAAQRLGTNIQNEYGEQYWIGMVQDEQSAGMD